MNEEKQTEEKTTTSKNCNNWIVDIILCNYWHILSWSVKKFLVPNLVSTCNKGSEKMMIEGRGSNDDDQLFIGYNDGFNLIINLNY